MVKQGTMCNAVIDFSVRAKSGVKFYYQSFIEGYITKSSFSFQNVSPKP